MKTIDMTALAEAQRLVDRRARTATTVTEARAVLAEIVAKAKGTEPGWPKRLVGSGLAPQDLTGRIVGDFVVAGFLATSPVSPWWAGRCVACGGYDVVRGNQVRNGVQRHHVACPKRNPYADVARPAR